MMVTFSHTNSTPRTTLIHNPTLVLTEMIIFASLFKVCPPSFYCDKVLIIRGIDTETYQKLSLEEVKIKAEDDRVQKLANEHKNKIREVLKTLKDRYKKLLIRNSKLLESQVGIDFLVVAFGVIVEIR